VKRFKVRLATAKDIEVLVRQRHMMFEDMRHLTSEEHKIGDDSYRTWARAMMKRKLLRCYLVVDEEGEIGASGCVWLRDIQPGPGHGPQRIPYLMSMYTDRKFRRKGLASMIVKEAMNWAERRGYPEMTLHASKMGRRVYTKLGWARTWEMEVELDQVRNDAAL
jgi:GNAT superfamily N-acetyltransferase